MSFFAAFIGLSLISPNFQEQGFIPKEYSCVGQDTSPELRWKDAPPETKSFALTIVDPDAPGGNFIHWVLYNVPATETSLPPNIPLEAVLPNGSMQGFNQFGKIGYGGPCPPLAETHSYIFTLYALDTMLPLPPGSSYAVLKNSMEGHILAESKLTGRFAK